MSTEVEVGRLVATARSLTTRAQAIIDMGVSPEAMAVIFGDVLSTGDAAINSVIRDAINNAIISHGEVGVAVESAIQAAIDAGQINGITQAQFETALNSAVAAGALDSPSTIDAKIQNAIAENRLGVMLRPENASPSDGQTGLTSQPTLAGADYYALYAVPQKHRKFRVYDQSGAMIYEATEAPSNGVPAVSHTVPSGTLTIESGYTWNYQDINTLDEEGGWSERTSFTTASIYVATPAITSPANGATGIGETPTLTTSAFAVEPSPESDAHTASSWRIRDVGGSVVWESLEDAGNLTSIQVPSDVLQEGSRDYTIEVRHHGQTYGDSAWSPAIGFTTAAQFGPGTGEAGGQGFGVGVYPGPPPPGFSTMSGHDDPASDNYGNYQYQDGSVMVFVPAFYYRFGHQESPRYADYGANALDIVSASTYADRTAAAADGYALHRAFIDGGEIKSGFFIDKYLNSKSAGNDAGVSVKGGVPISLTALATYTKSDGMTGCTGILADAVTLSRARGSGFNCASVFMYSALALLSMAHGQAAISTTHCAWYDGSGSTNHPKGCNNGALGDTDDDNVAFASAGDGNADKPKAGSGTPFAKTTHNGQACGVADINGSMLQPALGITTPGSSAIDANSVSHGDCYVLKESVSLGHLTGGYGGVNDAWGDEADLGTKYDAHPSILPWGSTVDEVSFGNGDYQVFNGAPDRLSLGYLRTACGIQQDNVSMSSPGTNLFGSDRCYMGNHANLFATCGGHWGTATWAGVFARYWTTHRSLSNAVAGFRAALYGA